MLLNWDMAKFNMLHRLIRTEGQTLLVSVAILLSISATSFSQIIASNRRTIWQGNVGVPNGIPNRTTIYTTIPAGASLSTIQSAINACPSNQVVLLSAGTYSLSGTLNVSKSGVTLRGAGTGKTILSGGGYVLVGDMNWYNDYATPNKNRHVNWTSGYAQGSTTITVASTGDLAVGELIFMDQLNDANVDYVGACNGPVAGEYSSVANPNVGQDRLQHQMNRVVAINGTTLTLSDPVYMPNYQSSLTPQVWWYGYQPVQLSGVEDLTIIGGSGSSQGLYLQNAYGCWAKDLNVTKCRYYLNSMVTLRCEIRHCYAYGPQSTTDDYGYYLQKSSGLLMEDNADNNAGTMMLLIGVQGSVFGYNYGTNITGQSGWMQGGICTHGAHPNMNLFEGNVIPGWWIQNCWGSSIYNTAFRNRFTGKDEGMASQLSGDIQAVNIGKIQRYMNVVGNVLGTTGYNTWYEDSGSSYTCHNTSRVYAIGENSGGCSTDYDATTYSTLVRAMNWDSANQAIVAGGYTTSDLPASYYLASKPAWFGNLAWPPVDPSNPAYSSSRTNIPAGYRLAFGIDPPSSGTVNQPPVAIASASTNNGVAPLTVTFSSSGSYDPEGVSLTYSWNFGDGTTSTTANPSHAYQAAGTYSATLTVSDGVNTTTSSAIRITVTAVGTNQPPVASASATPLSGAAPLTVAFSSTGSSDPEGAALTYNWTFGDGSTSTAANPSHTYSVAGTYSAQLAVSDGTSTTSSSVLTITATTAVSTTPVAAYGFEEGSGTSVTDASGNGNSGTITGATWTSAGRYGKALLFNGTNSLVTIKDTAFLHLGSALTLEAWVNPTTLASWKNLIYKPQGSTGISYVLQGASSSSQVPSLGMSICSANLMAPNPLPLNTWSHIAATYDGTTARFYVNGTLVASQAQTGTITETTDALTIGGNSAYGENWAGLIDEVRIYNRALSATEVQTDMQTAVVARPPAPLGLRVVVQ
jgi:PKD repeat protein